MTHIHCRSRVRNIFLFRRKLECIVKPIYLLHILWNAIHLSMFVENKYRDSFYDTDFLTLINPFTLKPGHWQICVEYILTRSALPLDRDEIKWFNMTNNTYSLVSTIILPKVLILCYPLHLETLTVIYWNPCVHYIVKEENIWRILVIQNHSCNIGQWTCKTFRIS